jgi:hypothetical protein
MSEFSLSDFWPFTIYPLLIAFRGALLRFIGFNLANFSFGSFLVT